MTDEEMAEQYVKEVGFRSGMFGELDDITSSEANKEIKQAYLAGLKAGRDTAETDLATVAYMQGAESQKKKSEKQLTKAKEIIKLLLHSLKNEGADYTFALENTHPALTEAEQFLKDSEAEK